MISSSSNSSGAYPLKPKLPAAVGNEGVGVVSKCGKAVSHVKEGDWVIPVAAGVGESEGIF